MRRIGSLDATRVVLVWLAVSAMLVATTWSRISTLSFADPDDAMRLKQVLDLLGGQSWWDLRQHAVDPPLGTDMHWSRLVDIPLAAILGPASSLLQRNDALRVAVTVAPLLPMLVAMLAMAHAVRRLVDPRAGAMGALCLGLSTIATLMWTPLRIDHHGWQIALAAVMMAALVGDRTWRTGLTAGVSCALSLSIGMESTPIAVVVGVLVVARWVETGSPGEMRAFGACLLALLPAGYELLQPWDNARPLCDALTPVWTTDGALGGLLLVAASLVRTGARGRAAATIVAVAGVIVHHALRWHGCYLPSDQVGGLAQRIWLDQNNETKPLTSAAWPYVLNLAIPCIVAASVMWSALSTVEWRRWLAPAAMFAMMLCISLWRVRGTALLQMTAVPGVTYLVWSMISKADGLPTIEGRIASRILPPVLATGWIVALAVGGLGMLGRPSPAQAARSGCMEGTRMERLERMPGDVTLATINLSPFIAAFTHHRVLAGPYHRDAGAVVDLILDWHEPPARVLATVRKRHVDLVVACPGGEGDPDPASFARQLAEGSIPWLRPISDPGLAPLRAWRVDAAAVGDGAGR